MGIMERFSDIISSNINAILDKLEDPKKMIDQMLRNAIEDLAEVKKDTAAVIAEEKRCSRMVEEIQKNIAKYEGLAIKAIQAGNDGDATVFLQEKAKHTADLVPAQATLEAAAANSAKMRQMHDKLTTDINTLKARQASIKATISVAETQNRINKMGNITANDAISKFNSYEAKAQNMLDRANAEAELNAPVVSAADALAARYDSSTTDVSDELAALKAKLGQ
ncbi:MAG: PspA/IM30 family protein [Eubacteriales bacterium]